MTNTEIAGPHIILPTDREITVISHGRFKSWQCKYCGQTGTHPDDPPHNMAWRQPCNEFEPLESEQLALQ